MPAENIYRIKEGDTLSDLFGQNWQEVAAFNGIDDPTKLQVGQEINLNLYDYSIVPQGQESQEQQLSGEDEFKSGAADWATSFFREVGADARDVYEDLSASSIEDDDVFSSFTNSPMPTSLEGMEDIDSSFQMPEETPVVTPVVTPEETTPTPEESSLSSIAKQIGLPEGPLKTLIKLESGNVGYDIKNPKSSAYGKYQFMTGGTKSTGFAYAKDLGYAGKPGEDLRAWMTPDKQDQMFVNFTKDNMKGMGSLPKDTFHIYGAHQQGLKGFKEILSGNISETRAAKIKANLNGTGQDLEGKQLADYWIKYWKAKTN